MASTAQAPVLRQQVDAFKLRLVLMSVLLMVVDLSSTILATVLGFSLWLFVKPTLPFPRSAVWLFLIFSVIVFFFSDLYPGIGMTMVAQLRAMWRSLTLVYLLLTAAIFLAKEGHANSRGFLLLAWLISLILVPAARMICGQLLSSIPWWGVPVIIVGANEIAAAVVKTLKHNRMLGYNPVACADDHYGHASCEGVPVEGNLDDIPFIASRHGAQLVIVALPGFSGERLGSYLRNWAQIFPRVIFVPDLAGMASLWTESKDLGGQIGLEIHNKLLDPINQHIKRAVDIVSAASGLLLTLPLLAFCAAAVSIASPGNPFYTQIREGKYRRPIRVLKLRTMYTDAEQALEMHLANNDAARLEWSRFCKLKEDPRILPFIGHFLRRSSLDELPQLWNVLTGDMSLVGPRPFPAYHNSRFHPDFRDLRTRVIPGLTGLWQVGGRSDGDLHMQASLDTYYISNWSLWLDLYILIRTAKAVIMQDGSR